MNIISLLVGLRNNLDYNKHFYQTTRELYPDVEICFVSYGSTDGTHEWLDSLQDECVKYFYSDENKTFSDTFNKAAELATKDYVAYLHNDIVLAPGFLENLEKHVAPNNVVAYTTIEPPIFAGHERPGKLIYDLGDSLDTFHKDALYEFVESQQSKYNNKTEPDITFFMCMPRTKLLEIGGMDNLFNPMFCEDDDLIRRWKLLGMNCFTALDAICYHFVSKTSRFSEEYQNRTQQIELASNRNYIRKWGSRSADAPKYNIGFVVSNCSEQHLQILEPWCDRIYLQDGMNIIIDSYISKEQPNTKFNLKDRVLQMPHRIPKEENDILVYVDCLKLNQAPFNIMQNLPAIIENSGAIGEFELDIFKLNIQSLTRYELDLIKLK